MARPRDRNPRPRPPAPGPAPAPVPVPVPADTPPAPEPARPSRSAWAGYGAAACLLLALQVALAADSLRRENPTVDETAHMPAGISYWQRGTFRLYHHNPPLVKLIAAAPVVLAGPSMEGMYDTRAWRDGSQAGFAEQFAYQNANRYFELFTSARLMMPWFLVAGGVAVFLWSARLYGGAGGLLSLALWILCPNILAHGRLVTGDAPAASLAVAATYLFWRFLQRPGWGRAVGVGAVLGLAQLTKFSALVLYGLWPVLALVRWSTLGRGEGAVPWRGWLARMAGQAAVIVATSVLVINLGYGFEGTGEPLGRFEFASRSLTRPIRPGTMARPTDPNPILAGAWRYRINRFRGTFLEGLPVPLPRHYVLGFDEQKIETEGIPMHFLYKGGPVDDDRLSGYSVYLNGEMRRSGWWYYYLATLAYKVPEGTWILVGFGAVVLAISARSRAPWADEFAVLAIPVGMILTMSFLTDICLGLRYILPSFPFAFVATGKVAPWALGQAGRLRRGLAGASVVGSIGLTAAATASIHPHYLAYFNRVAGGPDRGSEHLIDSNLDWGQDLTQLAAWLRANRPGERVGLAYFGQINPSILALRGEGFRWFLPPGGPGALWPMIDDPKPLIGPAPRLTPGLYAVSASVVRGLPWRFHDPISMAMPGSYWSVAWNDQVGAFRYFKKFTPIARVGHSIFVYDLSAADCAVINRALDRSNRGGSDPEPY